MQTPYAYLCVDDISPCYHHVYRVPTPYMTLSRSGRRQGGDRSYLSHCAPGKHGQETGVGGHSKGCIRLKLVTLI